MGLVQRSEGVELRCVPIGTDNSVFQVDTRVEKNALKRSR